MLSTDLLISGPPLNLFSRLARDPAIPSRKDFAAGRRHMAPAHDMRHKRTGAPPHVMIDPANVFAEQTHGDKLAPYEDDQNLKKS